MWFWVIMLGLCAHLAHTTYRGLLTARQRRCRETSAMFLLLLAGVTVSGMAYALRICAAGDSGVVQLSAFCSCAGFVILCLGWLKLPLAAAEQTRERAVGCDEGCFTAPVEYSIRLGISGGAERKPLSMLAYHVLVKAQWEAEYEGHSCVDVDHLVARLLSEPRSVGRLIVNLLISKDQNLRKQEWRMEGVVSPAAAPTACVDWIPITLCDRARKALDFAALEARRFGSDYVGTEHLLLGVLLTGAGEAAVTLFQQGVTIDEVRKHILSFRAVSRQAAP
ncbi:MAG: ATPase domain protein [Capsulimonas sp.]|nr:ATPase domain protein [Capsulimonas sp.]